MSKTLSKKLTQSAMSKVLDNNKQANGSFGLGAGLDKKQMKKLTKDLAKLDKKQAKQESRAAKAEKLKAEVLGSIDTTSYTHDGFGI